MTESSTARANILARLRAGLESEPNHAPPPAVDDATWRAAQPPLGDPAERFITEQQAVGGEVRRVADWAAVPAALVAWLREWEVRTVMLGSEPRLAPTRDAVWSDGAFQVQVYDQPVEQQREALFNSDCGITTSRGAIAETGSVILVPSVAEPRLLSLALPVHLVIVERERMHPTLADFIASGEYQAELPSNLVLVSGASRTADIELTLVVGVHGPKRFGVILIG